MRMSSKSLKSAVIEPAAPPPPHVSPRPDADSLRRVAAVSRRSLPPAVPVRGRWTTLINVKVGGDLADALAEWAARDGITQKQLICRALAAYGLPVDPLDLEDRTRRRQRVA